MNDIEQQLGQALSARPLHATPSLVDVHRRVRGLRRRNSAVKAGGFLAVGAAAVAVVASRNPGPGSVGDAPGEAVPCDVATITTPEATTTILAEPARTLPGTTVVVDPAPTTTVTPMTDTAMTADVPLTTVLGINTPDGPVFVESTVPGAPGFTDTTTTSIGHGGGVSYGPMEATSTVLAGAATLPATGPATVPIEFATSTTCVPQVEPGRTTTTIAPETTVSTTAVTEVPWMPDCESTPPWVMADMVLLELQEAVDRLTQLCPGLGTVTSLDGNSVDPTRIFVVVAQDPAAGEPVSPGDVVTLTATQNP